MGCATLIVVGWSWVTVGFAVGIRRLLEAGLLLPHELVQNWQAEVGDSNLIQLRSNLASLSDHALLE